MSSISRNMGPLELWLYQVVPCPRWGGSCLRCLAECLAERSRAIDATSATPKGHSFAPDRVFTREFVRYRTATLPNYLMMGG